MTTTMFHKPRRSVLPFVSLAVAAGALALGTAAMITDDVATILPSAEVVQDAGSDARGNPPVAAVDSSGTPGVCEPAILARVVRC